MGDPLGDTAESRKSVQTATTDHDDVGRQRRSDERLDRIGVHSLHKRRPQMDVREIDILPLQRRYHSKRHLEAPRELFPSR